MYNGAQYTSRAFSRRLEEAGLVGSMGSAGDAVDNAVVESFYGALETELLGRQRWSTRQELKTAIVPYIEGFTTVGGIRCLDISRRWSTGSNGLRNEVCGSNRDSHAPRGTTKHGNGVMALNNQVSGW